MRLIRPADMTTYQSRSVVVLLVTLILATTLSMRAALAQAPEQHCAERHGIWCVLEGAETETRVHTTDKNVFAVYPAAQTARPDPLIFVVPAACRNSLSDRIDIVSFKLDQPYDGQIRDQLRIALSARCTVTAWLPAWTDDSSEWAYSGALPKLRQCMNASCDGKLLSSALTHIQPEYQRRLIRP